MQLIRDEIQYGKQETRYESQNGRENDGPAVSGHWADDVEQRLLAVNDVKQKDGKEEGMGVESEETKNQVNDVVDNLRVGADLFDAPLECSCVAHDAQQMNALQHNRGGAKEH